VAHTRSRQEKALCRDLVQGGIVHYLPSFRAMRTHGNRRRVVDAPLFPGYVFVRGGDDLRASLGRTDRVANLIEVVDQEGLVHELSQIERAIGAGVSFNPYPFLHAGTLVRVCRGPLRGIEGLVDRIESATRLVLVVQILGRATSVEVCPADLEPIGS